MDVAATETAITTLRDEPRPISTIGLLWRQRAAAHLVASLDVYLRGGVRPIRDEAAAMGFLKQAARDLRVAATALHEAAEQFRKLGHGYPANRTFHAATAAERAAENLDPG
jgi:hypothetical protein